ncbi:ARM repeat-containing protein, partial [Aureobasidium melanogenum]
KQAQIASRESDYQKRRFNRQLSPDGQSYKEVMKQRELEREEERVHKLIEEKQAKGEDGMDGVVEHKPTLKADEESGEVAAPRKRKQRWDTSSEDAAAKDAVVKSEDAPETKRSRWDSTPAPATQAEPRKRSRFDMAPSLTAATPVGGNAGLATPMHPSQAPAVGAGYGSDISARNAPLSDEELDMMLPGEKEGYRVLPFPPGYEPTRVPAHRVPSTPASLQGGFMMQQPVDPRSLGKDLPSELPGVGELRLKPEDMAYFGKLVDGADENEMSVDELKERKIMRLLIKVKNGTPPMRKTALRQLTDNARSFGAGPLF